MPTGSEAPAHALRDRAVAAKAPATSGKKRRRERIIGLLICGRCRSRGLIRTAVRSMRIGGTSKNEFLLRIAERSAASNEFYQFRAVFGKEIAPRIRHWPDEALPGFLHHQVISLPFHDYVHGGGRHAGEKAGSLDGVLLPIGHEIGTGVSLGQSEAHDVHIDL